MWICTNPKCAYAYYDEPKKCDRCLGTTFYKRYVMDPIRVPY